MAYFFILAALGEKEEKEDLLSMQRHINRKMSNSRDLKWLRVGRWLEYTTCIDVAIVAFEMNLLIVTKLFKAWHKYISGLTEYEASVI